MRTGLFLIAFFFGTHSCTAQSLNQKAFGFWTAGRKMDAPYTHFYRSMRQNLRVPGYLINPDSSAMVVSDPMGCSVIDSRRKRRKRIKLAKVQGKWTAINDSTLVVTSESFMGTSRDTLVLQGESMVKQ